MNHREKPGGHARRGLAGVLLAGVSLALLLSGCGAASENNSPSTQNPLTLKIGVSTGESDPRNIAAGLFAQEIEDMTNGALLGIVNGGGVLGSDAELIESMSLKSGKVDVIITDASNFATYEPKMGISALPFLFDDFDTAWAFMDSDIEAEAEKPLLKQNIRVLAHYCNGFRCVTSSRGPINSPADMKGLVIRTPENPVIMATMTALGANPQPLGFSELYAALRQGTYDAQENPVPVIYNNKLYEVQEYLSITNHIYSGMCFAISDAVWTRLSEEQRRIVQNAATSSAEVDRDMNRTQTTDLLSALEKEGMKINEPNRAPFVQETASVLQSNASVYGSLLDEMSDWMENR